MSVGNMLFPKAIDWRTLRDPTEILGSFKVLPKTQVTEFNMSHFCRTEVFLIFAPTRQLDRAMGHTVQGLVLLQHQDRFFCIIVGWLPRWVPSQRRLHGSSLQSSPMSPSSPRARSEELLHQKAPPKVLQKFYRTQVQSLPCFVSLWAESVTFCSFLVLLEVLDLLDGFL